MNAPVQLAQLRQPQAPTALANTMEPDYAVDLFSVRGFKLAHKIAELFASSDAVPAIFRSHTLKKGFSGNADIWVENPSAIGNCVVAIETARSVGMSITAVMQHANIIEGRLSWSAQFVIAAINASRRFTPLRFDIKNGGMVSATYKEKQGWNKPKGGFDFIDRTVDVENLICIAWAFPRDFTPPKNIYTLGQARAAELPVVESAPVSMLMAVQEGWYGKAGSKWQTEMKHQMLQYRSGAFFGRIHAPDVVMGMGRSTEEEQDMTTVDMSPAGTVERIYSTAEVRQQHTPMADVVQPGQDDPPVTGAPAGAAAAPAHAEATPPAAPARPAAAASRPAATPVTSPRSESGSSGDMPDYLFQDESSAPPRPRAKAAFDVEAFAVKLEACQEVETLDLMADEIRSMGNTDVAATLNDVYRRCRAAINSAQPVATPARRGRPINQPID